jgi:hypothetical protein
MFFKNVRRKKMRGVQAGVRALNQRAALLRGHSDTGKHAAFILGHVDQSIALYHQTKEQYEAKFVERLTQH